MNKFTSILNAVFEQPQHWVSAWEKDHRSTEELITALLGNSGEVSGSNLSREILSRYARMNQAEKIAFFRYLATDLDIDPTQIRKHLARYEVKPEQAHYQAFLQAAAPKRQALIRRLNEVRTATQSLVEMRAELLSLLPQEARLAPVDLDFKHLFTAWFNRGFLVLRAINWHTPADILEKIIRYEAVHEITSWDDLRSRLQPEDRRCFAYFHPAMPDEPLIFVEVGLTQSTPDSIQSLLSEERQFIPAAAADTAVFYSISNCQAGLAGISFGNSLIKQVVTELSQELPNLKTFITLSPILGYARWLNGQHANPRELTDTEHQQWAAHYLLTAKKPSGAPLDPISRFHLGNGASMHAIHSNADISTKGQKQSLGVMVNYLYDLRHIASNHEGFAAQQKIAASNQIKHLSKQVAGG